MITLAPVDYFLVITIFLVVMIKVVADFRDIKNVRRAARLTRQIVRRSFSPRFTIVVPFESIDGMKNTLTYYANTNMRPHTLVIVDSQKFPKASASLRRFVKKQDFKRVKVVQKKNPDSSSLAALHVRTGIVVMLPEGAELGDNFYDQAILPFADKTIGSVVLRPYVRAGQTLASGFEALLSSLRGYFSSGSKYTVQYRIAEEGVVTRAKYLRHTPKQLPRVVTTTKPAVSFRPQNGWRTTWRTLQSTMTLIDYIGSLVMTSIAVVCFLYIDTTMLVAVILFALYGVVVWWSLGGSTQTVVEKVSLLLIAPLWIIFSWGLIVYSLVKAATLLLVKIGRATKVVAPQSAA